MQGIDVRGLDILADQIDALLLEMPERKRTFHARISVRLKETVDAEIEMRLDDAEGHVRAWQTSSVGSGGGYAVVRPHKGKTGRDSPGAITNYLENGHRIRSSSHRARAFGFYAAARQSAKIILLEEAESFAAEIEEMLF